MICEVTAADLWLRVKLNCVSVGVSLRFDIKVLRTATIQQVKQAIFTYALDMMRLQGQEVICGLEDLHLAQASNSPDTPGIEPKISSSSTLVPLEDTAEVGKVFTFVSCFVTGTLICPEGKPIRSHISAIRDSLSSEKPEDFLSKNLSVRNIRIDALPTPIENTHNHSHGDLRCIGCTVS